jgi:integrase
MAREMGKLKALQVSRATKPGYLGDGGGLLLQVRTSGAKSWVYRYRSNGRLREMGLGSLDAVCLADARQRAHECRQMRGRGIDPLEHRKAGHARAALDAAKTVTFGECAASYIEAHKAGWKNAKHAKQWSATLATHAASINALPVQGIDTQLVIKVLEPIWTAKPETASRVRGRIESVLDWAKVRGYREGENPARWKGHLDHLLPARSKVRRVSHHAALPYPEMGAFMETLRGQESVGAAALEFAILTAARTGEVIGARWDEIDRRAGTWTIDGARMKSGRTHRVPLSRPALAVLERMDEVRESEFIFPGGRRGKGLSNMALLQTLRRMKRSDLTAHGFRSTFRDWTSECTAFPREVAEAALAHSVESKVEAAYRRGDLFEKRARLMDAWAKHCGTPRVESSGQVVKLRTK